MNPYSEGQEAAEQGLRTADNPYKLSEQNLEHIDWLLGFIDKNLKIWFDKGDEE